MVQGQNFIWGPFISVNSVAPVSHYYLLLQSIWSFKTRAFINAVELNQSPCTYTLCNFKNNRFIQIEILFFVKAYESTILLKTCYNLIGENIATTRCVASNVLLSGFQIYREKYS